MKEQGLELGKWYEKDILIDMANVSDGVDGYTDRWEFSNYNYSDYTDLSKFRLMEILK